ncbi:toxin TcdB middle/C-terminal domain-containing protein [Xenorhabdus ishibashii]|uniref:toxin TcdB middle/C-terminal domain-containing protein n=1 Tax=Xenorhabdus ishibashii TaxID=1034471 RepID=UPI003CC5158C
MRINLPENVRFDRTCQLHIADTQGLGVSSIILTVPHRTVKHWRLDLTQHKPGLLNTINNNMGTETTLFYRSSAQFWLDEKHQAESMDRSVTSYLPFPIHVLWRTEVLDEITGNRLTSIQEYAHGVWDGREREFRGFARVMQTDTDIFAQGTGTDNTTPEAFPSRTVSWFATGVTEVDDRLATEFWRGDDLAYPVFSTRFSRYDTDKQRDVEIRPSAEDTYWLQRALKGQLLRSELYGDDNSAQARIPYTVTDVRTQVRRVSGLSGDEPAAWVTGIENRLYHYERVANDPQCSQQVILASDAWGYPLASVNIAYPRRPKPVESPYPDTLPDTLFSSSYDEQQQVLRLTQQRQTWHHLTDNTEFILGIQDISRSDGWEYGTNSVPQKGLSLEALIADDSLIAIGTPSIYQGHQRIAYTGKDEKPAFPPLIAYAESAEMDAQALKAFDNIMSSDELKKMLEESGYLPVIPPLNDRDEEPVWVARRGYTDHGDITRFYSPSAQRQTLLTGKTTVTWDKHFCVVTEMQDAAGLQTKAEYDYRFMAPSHITDANDNHQFATFDALGRLTSSRFWGTENGKQQGYTPPSEEQIPFSIPTTIEAALALPVGLPVAQCIIYNPLSWKLSTEHEEETSTRMPPHILVITTDRYDSDPRQQLRQTLSFSDGFSRELQTAARYEAGEAWQWAADNSGLITDKEGNPVVVQTDTRWAVSGRTEYDGKGQPLRTYQPYFLNSWKYVKDDSARQDLYADTHYYDPLGREYQVQTAKGYLSRRLITPWFMVSEDENDTAS